MIAICKIRIEGFCEYNVFESVVQHNEKFDAICLIIRYGWALTFMAMASKASLGVATLGMITSLYLKIKIIYSKDGASHLKRYSKWIYSGMAFTMLFNAAYVMWISIVMHLDYNKYFVGFKITKHYKEFWVWF